MLSHSSETVMTTRIPDPADPMSWHDSYNEYCWCSPKILCPLCPGEGDYMARWTGTCPHTTLMVIHRSKEELN